MIMNNILWGGATASSQYEGGFEERGLDTQDCRPYLPRTSQATTETRLITQHWIDEAKNPDSKYFYPFRVGSKGYEYIDEDLALIQELDLDLYRLSISWSRLFPTGEASEPSESGVRYYDKIFNFLKHHNIKIFVTMNHYAVPMYLIEKYGGWYHKQMIDAYMHFSEFVLRRWGDVVDYWLPFNEINAGYFSPYNGVALIKQDQETYNLTQIFQCLHHQFVASAKTIQLGRSLSVKGSFGAMISCFCYYPLTPKPEDNHQLVCDEQINQWFCMDVLSKGSYPYYMEYFFKEHHIDLDRTKEELELLKEYPCDFVSFSYYSSSIASVDESKQQTAGNLVATTKNPYLKATEWGWQIDPLGLETTLRKVYDRYEKPVMVAENGLGAYDELTQEDKIHDPYRSAYLKEHMNAVIHAKEQGIDVQAYIAWGIIDIVSAGSCEMEKRYGVIYVDADNQGNGTYKRYKKDSFYWYQQFIKAYHDSKSMNQ